MGIKIEKQFLLILKTKGHSDAFTNTNFIVFIVNAERYNISPIPSFASISPTRTHISNRVEGFSVPTCFALSRYLHVGTWSAIRHLRKSGPISGWWWWEDRIIKLDDEMLTRCQKLGD